MEKSVGAIIFRKENSQIKYLLMQHARVGRVDNPYWDFPKGHVEKGETEGRAMRREIFEETGVNDLTLVPKFRETMKVFFRWQGKTIFKIIVFYLGETKAMEVKISSEHMGYKWLGYEDALKELTFDNAKSILKKANDRLTADEK